MKQVFSAFMTSRRSWLVGACGVLAMSIMASHAADEKTPALLNHTMKSLSGKDVELSKYKGKVLLIVNVASKCGATPQYTQLEALHEKYNEKGLAVLGFPCNEFGKQEPGSSEEIASFCQKNYGVKFDLFEKIDVNGDNAAPIYKQLKAADPAKGGDIKWNFEKFVVGRDGKVVARFATGVKPDAPEVVKAIETALAQKVN